jgi:preprotein translocase subunit SecF
MKFASKLNRSHLVISIVSVVVTLVLMYVLGYLKFSEGYESPEALELELNELLKEMAKTPVLKGMKKLEESVQVKKVA